MKICHFFFSILLFVSGILTSSTFAQWATDSTVTTKVCQAAGDQKYPEIVSDGAGGAIIVWQDGRAASTKIYAQRIDSSGVARWATNGVLICNAADSKSPKLTIDGAGGAIITWFDFRNGWPNSYVCAQRVNGNGNTLWQGDGIVLSSSANSWAYPAIAGYGSNGAIVAWYGVKNEFYAQKIDTSGNMQWSAGSVMIDTNVTSSLQMVSDGSGGAIFVWSRYDPDMINFSIFAQRVSSSGAVMWLSTGDTISYAPRSQHHPQLVPDASGGAVVGWLDNRSDTAAYPYAQRVGASAGMNWIKDGVQVSSTNGYFGVQIASDGVGGAVFAWLGGTNSDLYVRRISGGGVPLWSDDIRLTVNKFPSIPHILSDGSTGVFVVWENPAENKIKAQHISSNGTPSFAADGKTVSMGNGLNGYFAVVTDGMGRAIIAWEDIPLFTTDIRAQRVVVPGFTTGVSTDKQFERTPREFALNQNYPNPFNPSTTISYQLPTQRHVTLKVFDVLGREVATLVNGVEEPGYKSVTFNASKFSSGVYFYRLQAGSPSTSSGQRYIETKKLLLLR